MDTISSDLCAWKSLFASATDQASKAISLWTHGDVVLSLDEVKETSLCDVAEVLKLSNELSTLVRVGIEGEYGGQLLLTFDDTNAGNLISSLLNRPVNSNGNWNTLEQSALAETGNIIGSVYLNCMTELAACRLWPTPPQVLRDYAMSLIEQAVMTQAIYDDRIMLCKTRFECQGRHVQWNLVFIPSPELMRLIENSLYQNC